MLEQVRQSVGAATRMAAAALSESATVTRVAIALENANGLNETAIEFAVDGGQITLTGEVSHPAEVTLAEYVVREVHGVARVENKLVVKRKA